MTNVNNCSICGITIYSSYLCSECKDEISLSTSSGKSFNKEEIATKVKKEREKRKRQEIKELKSRGKQTELNTIMIPEDEIRILRNKNIQLETESKKLINLLKEVLENGYKPHCEENCLEIVTKIQKYLLSKEFKNNKPLIDEEILNNSNGMTEDERNNLD